MYSNQFFIIVEIHLSRDRDTEMFQKNLISNPADQDHSILSKGDEKMNAKNVVRYLSIVVLFTFLLTACGVSQPQAQATANAAVLTAMAGQNQPAAATQLPAVNPTSIPTTSTVVPPAANPTSTLAPVVSNPSSTGNCSPSVGNLDNMPKTVIELAPVGQWFHRVFNTRLFNEANQWGGADSWFVTLALGSNSGGNWTSMGNPGQIVYRGTSTHLTWCLGVLTTTQWKEQFMGSENTPAAINVRIAPDSIVTVVTSSGKTVNQTTSDMGDITIILPDNGAITISVDYITAAPTHESLVWWGPYDRSANINTIDAR